MLFIILAMLFNMYLFIEFQSKFNYQCQLPFFFFPFFLFFQCTVATIQWRRRCNTCEEQFWPDP